MTRSNAREIACHLVFEMNFNNMTAVEALQTLMEVCMYEALYIDDAPISAAINEAVELTRKYENEDVVSFVNGILGGFAREVQQPC